MDIAAPGPLRRVLGDPARRRWGFDALVALVVTGIAVAGSVGEAGAVATYLPRGSHAHVVALGPPGIALVAIAGAALLWRRRWPVATLLVTWSAVTAYTALGYVDGAVAIALMLAIYTVATLDSYRRSLALGLLATASVTVANTLVNPYGLLGGPVTVVAVMCLVVLVYGHYTASRRAQVREAEARARRAELSREEEATRRVAAERLRIARELHDVVAHSIATINVQAGAASHVIADHPEQAAEALRVIRAASKEALRELRAVLNVLRQADEGESTQPAPGLSQLDVLVAAAKQAGLRTTLSISGEPCALRADVDLAAYRIVQESLTNVLRHAGPASTTIALAYGADHLRVQVDDDGGRGTANGGGGAGTGHGLTGMRERAEAVGGAVEAGPRPGGGFRVLARLPALRSETATAP
ncbi:MAG TPA: histidine kinase [Candidatus Micrarchaeia archaeon]|nr:histidine kinase [Candidatus Micrarchaeia archaeon]